MKKIIQCMALFVALPLFAVVDEGDCREARQIEGRGWHSRCVESRERRMSPSEAIGECDREQNIQRQILKECREQGMGW